MSDINQGSINSQSTFESMPREIGERLAALRIMPTELLGKIPETVWQTLNIDQRAEILRQYGILEKYVRVTETQLDQVVEPGSGLEAANLNGQLQSTEVSLDVAQQSAQTPAQGANSQIPGQSEAPSQAPTVTEITHETEPDAQKVEFSKQVEQQRLNELQNSQLQNATTEVEVPAIEKTAEIAAETSDGESTQVQQEIIIEPDKNSLSKDKAFDEVPTEKIVPKFFGYSVTDDTARNAKELAESGDTREGRVWAAGLLQKIWDAIFN